MSSKMSIESGERIIVAVSPTIPTDLTQYRKKYWSYQMLEDTDRYVATLLEPFTDIDTSGMNNLEGFYNGRDSLGGMGLLPHVNDDPNGAISHSNLHRYQPDDGEVFTPREVFEHMLSEFVSGRGASYDKSKLVMLIVSTSNFREQLLGVINESIIPRIVTPELHSSGQIQILRLGKKKLVDAIRLKEYSNNN